MEILSPAGNSKILRTAVKSGADAVYFGVKNFSARAGADNFTFEEAEESIQFCKKRGVKTYAALNTIISDTEIKDALLTAHKLCDMGIDAFIVQDIGFASLLKNCTNVPLHASTQMSAHSLDGVLFLEDMGFKRVVLARELHEKDIEYITTHISKNMEIEIFVHGALCMSYSGQCYMSSVIGERSANRGRCAQPCRLPYRSGYSLSLKDLCMLRHVKRLKEIGVHSIKIEGRMKGEDYVAAVTEAYKSAELTGYNSENEKHLADIFSRGGFTDSYFINKMPPKGKMFGIKSEKLATHNISTKEYKRIKIDFSIFVKEDYSVKITAKTGDGFTSEYEFISEQPKNRITDEDMLREAFSRLGDTVYFLGNVIYSHNTDCFMPLSVLNKARRGLIESIDKMRMINLNYFKPESMAVKRRLYTNDAECTRLEGLFTDSERFLKINTVFDGLDKIWLPITDIGKRGFKRAYELFGEKTGVFLPRVFHDSEGFQIKQMLNDCIKLGIKKILCGNIGQIKMLESISRDFEIHGDYGLNIFNTEALNFFLDRGLESVTLSFELNEQKLKEMYNPRAGITGYGRLPFMYIKNCIKENHLKNDYLVDRKNEKFLLTCEYGCRNQIWNSKILYLADKRIPAAFLRMVFTDEDINTIEQRIKEYSEFVSYPPPGLDITRGLYNKKI